MIRHIIENGLPMCLQPQRNMTPLGARRRIAGPPSAQLGLVDEGDADIEPLGHVAGRLSCIKGSQNLVAKVLRIRPTRPPAHVNLRFQPDVDESHGHRVAEAQTMIPVRPVPL